MILLLVFATRFPYRTRIAYDWDSAQFMLGMKHFDVSLFQPHPPGYLFYIMSARAVNFFVHDENTSLVLLSIAGSAVALLFTYLLGMEIGGRLVAFRTAALLFASPLFWMFGEIGNPDILDAAFSSCFVYLAWKIFKGEHHLILWLTVLLGVASGFRTGLLIFLGPLWLCVVIYPRQKLKSLTVNSALIACITATWIIPAILMTGGTEKYRHSFLEVSHSFLDTSVFYSGARGFNNNVFHMFTSVFFSGLCFFSVVFLSLTPVMLRSAWNKFRHKQMKPGTASFLLVTWVMPAMIFLLTVHFGVYAFGLFFLPPFFLAGVKVLNDFADEILKKGLRIPSFVYSIFPIMLFILLNGMISFATIPQFIKNNNVNWERRKGAIQSMPRTETVILSSFDHDGANYFRHAMIYLPEYRVFFIPDILSKNSAKKNMKSFNGKTQKLASAHRGENAEVRLPAGTRYIVIIDPPLLKLMGINNDYLKWIDARGKKIIRYRYKHFELK